MVAISDQVYGDPGAHDSREADIDDGVDSAAESAALAGVPGPPVPEEHNDTSHDADIAGYVGIDDDRRLGLH